MKLPDGYETIHELRPVRQYVNAFYGVREECRFPNLVFQGWLKDDRTGDSWVTYMCAWSPTMWTELFSPEEWRDIRLLRWEYQHTERYAEV